MDTLELVSRMQATDLDDATIEALRLTTDRLCSDYPFLPSDQLLTEGRNWLRRLNALRGQRLTLAQHREILVLTGWLALLIGCVEYDSGRRNEAETTRRAALSLGTETDNAVITAWAHEMRAWMALTTGDYRGVVVAAQNGIDAAPHHSVAVQLAAQEAKAWARIGDRRQTEVALDRGRRLLDSLPYPDNLDHHFVVDPTKFDFYAMDCYRRLGNDPIAETLADEVIEAGTDFDGTERSPHADRGSAHHARGCRSPPGRAGTRRPARRTRTCRRAQVRSIASHGQPRPYQGAQGPLPRRAAHQVLPR
jgi:hypothetical protein